MAERVRVARGMWVLSSDGHRLGKVVVGSHEHFEILSGFFFPAIHLVAYADVDRLEGDTVHLKLPRASLRELWRAQEDYEEVGERRRAMESARRHAREAGGETPSGPRV